MIVVDSEQIAHLSYPDHGKGLALTLTPAAEVTGVESPARPRARWPGNPKVLESAVHMLYPILPNLQRGWRGGRRSAAGTEWGSG